MLLERMPLLIILALGVAVLTACAPAVVPLPTIEASPEIVRPTVSPSATLFIAETKITTINIADLLIDEPGPDSELVSPIHILAQVPAAGGVLRVELYGEDGRLLARQVMRTQGGSQLELELAFETGKPVEHARLALSLDDAFGRLQELTSIEIVLLAGGESGLAAAGPQNMLAIESPSAGDTVAGGTITVAGLVHQDEGSLNVQLISREGRVLKSIDLRPAGDEGEETTFSADLIYNLDEAAWVQVAVSWRQAGIITAFKSVEVWLVP